MNEQLNKIIKPCMVWHHKVGGLLLVFFGIWFYLKNVGMVSETIFWPVILIVLGVVGLLEGKLVWEKV